MFKDLISKIFAPKNKVQPGGNIIKLPGGGTVHENAKNPTDTVGYSIADWNKIPVKQKSEMIANSRLDSIRDKNIISPIPNTPSPSLVLTPPAPAKSPMQELLSKIMNFNKGVPVKSVVKSPVALPSPSPSPMPVVQTTPVPEKKSFDMTSLLRMIPRVQAQDIDPTAPGLTVNGVANVPRSTPSPTPTPIPSGITRLGPVTPQDIPQTYYTNRNSKIEPKLWDAIMNAKPTSDPELNDYMKRMALALATQESGGGYTLEGDNGKSQGPYHIQRANVPVENRYDPKTSTELVFKEMLNNMVKNGVPRDRSLRTWNWYSGYSNKGPKYNVDIPQMATTSSFYRGN